ncbi:hypothetical protein ONZ45_g19268 [Pleurotus djamor]|nr:hypothetical protein ONZ45_g19268 [Pleurotus djamor]
MQDGDLSNYTFWSHLTGTRHPPVLTARLSHTRHSVPIDYVDDEKYSTWYTEESNDINRIVFSELHHLRLLVLPVDLNCLEANREILNTDAPMLEVLRLSGPTYANGVEPPSFPTLFGGTRPPHLRELKLEQFKLPWSSPLLNNLTTFVLDSQIRISTYSKLRRILYRMPSLQILELPRCLPKHVRVSGHDFEINLPELRALRLDDNPETIFVFIKALKASLRSISITGPFSTTQYTPLFAQCARLSPMFSSTTSPSYLSDITIRSHRDKYGMSYRVYGESKDTTEAGDAMGTLSLNFLLPWKDQRGFVAKRLLFALPLDKLEKIHVSYDMQDSADLWMEIVGPRAKSLKTLHLSLAEVTQFFRAYVQYLDREVQNEEHDEGQVDRAEGLFDNLSTVVWQSDGMEGMAALTPYTQKIGEFRRTLGLPQIYTDILW